MKLMTATALALTVAASGALADTPAQDMNGDATMKSGSHAGMMAEKGNLIRTRDITGGTIYSTSNADNNDWISDSVQNKVNDNWNVIGEIEDVVLSKDGQMIGIVGEVGGFLDIADKHVMIPVDDVNLVAVDDMEYALVTRLSEEQLEERESVDEGFWN